MQVFHLCGIHDGVLTVNINFVFYICPKGTFAQTLVKSYTKKIRDPY